MGFRVLTLTAGLNAEVAFCCTAVQRAIKFENMLEYLKLILTKRKLQKTSAQTPSVCLAPAGDKVRLSEELTLK